MAKKENYYEIENKIYSILQKFEIVTVVNVIDVYTEAQSLIFEYDILKQHFINKVKVALINVNSEKYKSIIKSNYDKVKKYVKNKLKDKNVKLSYIDEKINNDSKKKSEYELNASKFPYPNYSFAQDKVIILEELVEKGVFDDYESVIIEDDWYEKCSDYAELIDIPSLFIYESVLSLILKDFNEQALENVPILNWNDLTEFYLETFGHSFVELLKIPQNIDIEYLIIALNIGKYTHKTRFHLFIAITCLSVILNDLLKIIYEELEKIYGFEIPEKNKYKQHINSHVYIVKISKKTDKNHLFIDEKPVEKISKLDIDFIEQVYKNIYDTENGSFDADPNLSNRASKINKRILNLIKKEVGLSKNKRLIVMDNHSKKYIINKQLYNIQIIN